LPIKGRWFSFMCMGSGADRWAITYIRVMVFSSFLQARLF
jgi:hypothetical protein